jgi:hypothetical protein
MIDFIRAIALISPTKLSRIFHTLLITRFFLMFPFLLLTACTALLSPPSESIRISETSSMVQSPQSLAVYYGWPSAVHSEQSPHLSPAEIFLQYDVVVLGGGLADPSHPEHENAIVLMNLLRNQGIVVFGYVDMGVSTRPYPPTIEDLRKEVGQWKAMGAVGIFWDDVGREFAPMLTQEEYQRRVDSLITYTHGEGLRAFLNIWNPQDLFLPPSLHDNDGNESELRKDVPVGEGDIILAESWLVSNDTFIDPDMWYHQAERLKNYRRQFRFSLACLATGADGPGVEESGIFRSAYWASFMYQCDLFQFTDPQYGAGINADANKLNYHPSPSLPQGERILGEVQRRKDGDWYIFETRTSHGRIVVTTDGRERGDGGFFPDQQAP